MLFKELKTGDIFTYTDDNDDTTVFMKIPEYTEYIPIEKWKRSKIPFHPYSIILWCKDRDKIGQYCRFLGKSEKILENIYFGDINK